MKRMLIFCIIFNTYYLNANIKFGNTDSKITIGADASLTVASNYMYINGGQLDRTELAEVRGTPIYFTRGKLSSYLSTSSFSGRYEGTTANIDALKPYEDPNELVWGACELGYHTDPAGLDFVLANPGGFRQKIYVDSGEHILRGQPLFPENGKTDIVLKDKYCLLGIGIQNTFNPRIALNGGVILLQDDLRLGDDAIFSGDGQVVFNNRRLSLGGTTAYWNDRILWNSAFDLQLNSLTVLRGVWEFVGDGQINGNGNVLDIAGGGTIFVRPDSQLRLSGVKLKGLGSGNFFMGKNSVLRLSDVDIEMDADFTFNSGDVIIDGDTYVLTKDHILTFAEHPASGTKGTLTVDRVALTYDPLDFVDKLNIRPLAIQDPEHKFIKIINNGSIRKPRVESISFVSYGTDSAMQRYAVLWPERPMTIFPEGKDGVFNFNITIDGKTQFVSFTTTDKPLLYISDNVKATYENVYFREFSPKHLSLGQNATLTFGNNTTVKLWSDDELNYRWTFKGNTALRGAGAILTLGEAGEIVLEGENSVLYIESVEFKGLSGTKIRCTSNTSKIIFKDVSWIQDGDFDYNYGAIDVLGDWMLIGPGKPITISETGHDVVGIHTFNYKSNQKINILDNGTMSLMKGMKFNYEPSNKDKNLIVMKKSSSMLVLDESVLSAPAPGLQLTVGRLVINKQCYAKNDGSGGNEEDSIIFGNGDKDGNLFIDQSGDASIQALTGFIINKNV
jgi:hypothetical protein